MNSNFWTNLINDFLTLGVYTGLFLWLYFGILSPAMHAVAAKQKSQKRRAELETAITIFDHAVSGVSIFINATGAEKKAEAIKRADAALKARDITLTTQEIADGIEHSFQTRFSQTNAPALANAQSAYEQQSTAAASQMAATQSAAGSTADIVAASAPAGLNPTMGATALVSTASPITSQATPESVATTNG